MSLLSLLGVQGPHALAATALRRPCTELGVVGAAADTSAWLGADSPGPAAGLSRPPECPSSRQSITSVSIGRKAPKLEQMEPLDETSWIASATEGARNGLNWLAAADSLKRSSELLAHTSQQDLVAQFGAAERLFEDGYLFEAPVGRATFLLAGFAVENLLKGLIITRRPELVGSSPGSPDVLLDRQLQTHDLRKLSRLAGLQLSTEEQELLTPLEDFTVWAGRYPVALRASSMKPRPEAEGGGASFSLNHHRLLRDLFDRLRAILWDEASAAGARREEEKQQERQNRRVAIVARLEAIERRNVEGIQFFDTTAQDDPRAAVLCGTCRAQMILSPRTPAAICGCGTIYFGELRGAAGKIQFLVDEYPAP